MPVKVRAFTSPTLVLLAYDWPEGASHKDFLGFAIKRSPGHTPTAKSDYLLNKLTFVAGSKDAVPSDQAPIQKFLWWDSGVSDADRGKTFVYTVTPVLGTGPNDLAQQHDQERTIAVPIPKVIRNGIGTYFNRAVVSSQAFQRMKAKSSFDVQMAWLANGLQTAIPDFMQGHDRVEGAIYHLTDNHWVIPALRDYPGSLSMVYHDTKNDSVDEYAVDALKGLRRAFHERTKANIMHDKFLVKYDGTEPKALLMGSANFTPEALTTQANLLHTFASPELAALYADRAALLEKDATIGDTAKGAAWSKPVKVGKASVRVFFSPEPKNKRVSIDTVVEAVKKAKSSVLFCMFSPTDSDLLSALLATGDKKKLLFGLLNSISDPTKKKAKAADPDKTFNAPSAAAKIQIEVFHRSRKDRKVVSYDYFRKGIAPKGWLPELSTIDTSAYSIVPKKKTKGKARGAPAVHIHHKFIVIDAETANPVIYTGSANMSNNSIHRNDENLLEIKGDTALAATYLAEFLRLYNQYRARALWNWEQAGKKKTSDPLVLKRTSVWARKDYKTGTSECWSRERLSR